LFKSYRKATLVAGEAAAELLGGMSPGDPRFPVAREVLASANQGVRSTLLAYGNHVTEHGCREGGKPNPQAEIEKRLQQDMLKAREVFDTAIRKCAHLTSLCEHVPDTPIGRHAFAEAHHVRIRAYTVYLEALRRFADFTMSGEVPENQFPEDTEQSKPN
jgi:hypothetical protein